MILKIINENIIMIKIYTLLEKYLDKPWNFYYLSRNPSITLDFIERHLDKPWNWDYLSRHPNITLDFIERHLDKPWNWGLCGLTKSDYHTRFY